MADINQQAQEYYYLVQKGMAPAEAFKKVFPNGIPTAQERAKSAAGDQQKQAYGQLAGALAGLYGAKKLSEVELPSFGSLFGGSEAASAGSDVLSLSPTMPAVPSVGPTIANAAALPEAASPGLLSGVSAAPAYVPAAVIGATALGGKAAYDMLKGKKPGIPGRAILGMATGGLSELANGLLGQKSTSDRQKEAWSNLAKEGKASDFFFSSPVNQDQGVDDRKLASGELGGKDVWATSAFFNKFSKPGQTWDVTGTEAQREQVANEILANKLLDTRKGLTRFTDENAVQGIYDRIMGPKPQGGLQNLPVTKGPAMIDPAKLNLPAGQVSNLMPITPAPKGGLQTQVNPLVQALSRSRTASPGIDKNGKRIAY